MEFIETLEKRLAVLYDKAPHFSFSGRKWLADNSWWLMLAAVILGSLGVFGVLLFIFSAGALLTGFIGPAGAIISGFALLMTLFSLSLTIVTLALIAFAIVPLKEKRKKGWTLVFMALLLNVFAMLLDFLLQLDTGTFLRGLIVTAIGLYFMYEMREFFLEDINNGNTDMKYVLQKPVDKK